PAILATATRTLFPYTTLFRSGVCKVAEGHTHITDVLETSNIVKTKDPVTGTVGAEADGVRLDPESYVSMNFWGFPAKDGCAPALDRKSTRLNSSHVSISYAVF